MAKEIDCLFYLQQPQPFPGEIELCGLLSGLNFRKILDLYMCFFVENFILAATTVVVGRIFGHHLVKNFIQ